MDATPGGAFTTVACSGPGTPFTDSGLLPGAIRYYCVQVLNDEQESPLSPVQCDRT